MLWGFCVDGISCQAEPMESEGKFQQLKGAYIIQHDPPQSLDFCLACGCVRLSLHPGGLIASSYIETMSAYWLGGQHHFIVWVSVQARKRTLSKLQSNVFVVVATLHYTALLSPLL